MTFNCGSQICRSLAALPIIGALLCRWRDFINSWYYLCYCLYFLCFVTGLDASLSSDVCLLLFTRAMNCSRVFNGKLNFSYTLVNDNKTCPAFYSYFCPFLFCFLLCILFYIYFFHAFYILSHKRRLTGWRGGEWKWVPVLWRRWL